MNVFVITFCQSEQDLWGNLLVFDTIRTGFPTAKIAVVDNGSIEPCREAIRAASQKIGAEFWRLTDHSRPLRHDDILNRITRLTDDETWILVDPDMIFYEKVEDREFKGESVLAGAWIPGFNDEVSGCYTYPRLHTSLLWVLRPWTLRNEVWKIQERKWDWDPWRPMMLIESGHWFRYDTGAQLYLTVTTETFDVKKMNAFSHVMCGTNASYVYERLTPETRKLLEGIHEQARTSPEALRGLWKEQLAYLESRTHE